MSPRKQICKKKVTLTMLEKNTLNFLNKIYIFKIFTMNFKRRKRHSNAYSSGAGAQPCPDPLSNTASYPKSFFRLPFRFCFLLRQAYPAHARLTLDWHTVSCSAPVLGHKPTQAYPEKDEHWEHKVSLLWGQCRNCFKSLLIVQRHLLVTPWHILSIHKTQF